MLVFRAPRSFTGEDICEFHVHGGPRCSGRCLTRLRRCRVCRRRSLANSPGGRFAMGGSTSWRAEGLSDLIHARTEGQRRQALHHSLGRASELSRAGGGSLSRSWRRVEAAVDFVDEPGVAEEALRKVSEPLKALIAEMEMALAEAKRGAAIRDGVRVVLAGRAQCRKIKPAQFSRPAGCGDCFARSPARRVTSSR